MSNNFFLRNEIKQNTRRRNNDIGNLLRHDTLVIIKFCNILKLQNKMANTRTRDRMILLQHPFINIYATRLKYGLLFCYLINNVKKQKGPMTKINHSKEITRQTLI